MGRGVPLKIANTSTAAGCAAIPIMDEWSVLKENEGMTVRPRFLCFNCWDINGKPLPRVITWSINAEPLPEPPCLSPDHIISRTLENCHDLFKIVTPINVAVLRSYLQEHPNEAFCDSVCKGFERGFWPWANLDVEGYLDTHEEVRDAPREQRKVDFIHYQKDLEVFKGRFSHSFGRDLLPGMYAVPTFAVPKEKSDKLRLVTDQSAGKFPVNGLQATHNQPFPMDNMVQLGERIL
jgi:hypothetical protein